MNLSQYITLEPVEFDSSGEGRKNAGRLEFLAGWKLDSDYHSFGGFSAMLAMQNSRFMLLSDDGILAGFTLDEKNNLALRPFIAMLPDGPMPENELGKPNWDSESMAMDPDTGQFWVGFEHQHSIYRYGRSFSRVETSARIPAMQKWPLNGGAEAMLRIANKDAGKPARFLIFSESQQNKDGGTEVLIFEGDPVMKNTKAERFGYQAPKGYEITDAALLPDGKALILHRRLNPVDGFSAILSIADPEDITPGKVWTSTAIATLKPPLKVDNMEAIAVTQEGADTIVWLVSDNNYNFFQESLLMKFRLNSGKVKRNADGKAISGKEKAGTSPGFSSLPTVPKR